jgi:hypothetical protein
VRLRYTGLHPDFGSPLGPSVTPELRHLQVSLGAQLSYRKAADLLRMLLPPTGGTTHTTTRGRLIAVGERIDEEIRREITENRKPDKPAKQMIIGIDGAFVKGRPPTDRANLEIITGRIEADAGLPTVSGQKPTLSPVPNRSFSPVLTAEEARTLLDSIPRDADGKA